MLLIIGISILINAFDLYYKSLTFTVLSLSVCLFIKSISIIYCVRRNLQRIILGVCFSFSFFFFFFFFLFFLQLATLQIVLLGFIPMAYTLEGLSEQATELSTVIIIIVVVDVRLPFFSFSSLSNFS